MSRLAGKESAEQKQVSGLRIQPELNLDYPQSDIADISLDGATGNYQITTTFYGLYGISSPLPGFYTEELLDDEWDEYTARKDFFDVIHNHIYPLLYHAWLKYKLSHNMVEFEDHKYTEILFSIIGLNEAYRNENRNYGSLLRYSGLLSQRTRSLVGLKTLLKDHLGNIGIDIIPCVQRRVPIVDKQQCLLGAQSAILGVDTCIGVEVAGRTGKFNIEIGPLNAEQFADFSQSGKNIETIKVLLNIYLVQPLEFSIILLLQPDAVRPATIGELNSSILGVNCWLVSQSNTAMERVDLADVYA